MVASGLLFLLASSGLISGNLQAMRFLGEVLIIVNLALGIMYLGVSRSSGLAHRESVRRLNAGLLGLLFQGGAILVGMIIPLLMVLWLPSVLELAGLFILIGGLLFRYCVLKAGVYVPFPLT
jgi:formate-dependent nitrite reductase membrane component NrfD